MVTELLIVGCLNRSCLIYNVFLNICNNVELVISEQNEYAQLNCFYNCSFEVVGDMIRLFKVKEKQKEDAENNTGGTPVRKQCAGELRLHKGFFIVLDGCIFPFNLVVC